MTFVSAGPADSLTTWHAAFGQVQESIEAAAHARIETAIGLLVKLNVEQAGFCNVTADAIPPR